MDQRKLIKLGNSSFAIALPKEWVDKAGLKKGENIFIEENSNGELMITPSPLEKNNNKKTSMNIEDKNLDSIKREIIAAYIRGYNTIELKGANDKSIKNKIKRILNDFLSFELTESDKDKIIIKDFFNLEEANLSNFIRRIDNNVREMFDICLEEFKKKEISLKKINEIESIDYDTNKFYFLCSRIFLKGVDNPSILTTLKTSGMRLFNEWWFSFNLEALSDGLKYLLRDAYKREKELTKIKQEIHNLLLEIRDAYLMCAESYYKEDANQASQTMAMTRKLREKIERLENENSYLYSIFHDLEKIRKEIYQNSKMVLCIKY